MTSTASPEKKIVRQWPTLPSRLLTPLLLDKALIKQTTSNGVQLKFDFQTIRRLLHLTQCAFETIAVNEICEQIDSYFIDDLNDHFGTDSNECTLCDVPTAVIGEEVQQYAVLVVELYHHVKQSPKEDIKSLTIDEFTFIVSSTRFKHEYQRRALGVISSSWKRRCCGVKQYTRVNLLGDYEIEVKNGNMIDARIPFIEIVDLTVSEDKTQKNCSNLLRQRRVNEFFAKRPNQRQAAVIAPNAPKNTPIATVKPNRIQTWFRDVYKSQFELKMERDGARICNVRHGKIPFLHNDCRPLLELSVQPVRLDQIESLPGFDDLPNGDMFVCSLINWGRWLCQKRVVDFVENDVVYQMDYAFVEDRVNDDFGAPIRTQWKKLNNGQWTANYKFE